MGKNFYIDDTGHLTKKAAMPIYGKNLLFQNQKSYDLENWHVAFGDSSSTKII